MVREGKEEGERGMVERVASCRRSEGKEGGEGTVRHTACCCLSRAAAHPPQVVCLMHTHSQTSIYPAFLNPLLLYL